MIKKVDIYIIKTILSTVFVVLFSLLAIDMLGKILEEADILGDKNYTFTKLITFVFALVPLRLVNFFPISLMIGSIMGLGKLSSSSELVVMLSSGVSRFRIGVVGVTLSIFLGLLSLLIVEYIGSPLNTYAYNMRAEALNKVSETRKGNIWVADGNSFVQIKGVQADGSFKNVSIYTLDKDMKLKNIKVVKKVEFIDKEWVLLGVTNKTISKDNFKITKTKKELWKNNLDKSILTLLVSDPTELSVRELNKFIKYQQANKIKPTNFLLVLWQRLLIPITAGVMFLLAFPFSFSSQRNSNQGRKLFIGILLGLIYYISYSSISNFVILTGVSAALGAFLPIIIFLFISFILLKFYNFPS